VKIIKLIAENIKKLKAVEISPEGNVIKISGENEAGKSSVLDSIFYALDWKQASKEVSRPIRDGQSEAQVQLVLQRDEDDDFRLVGDSEIIDEKDTQRIIVTRKWTSNTKTYLKIETKDGSKFASPQLMLDSLVNDLSFDPFRFMRMSPKEQINQMFKLIKFKQDPRELDKERAKAYEERTTINRETVRLKGQLDGFRPDVPDESYPTKEITSESILVKLRKAREKKEQNDKLRNDLKNISTEFQAKKAEIIEVEEQIVELKKKHEVKIQELKDISEKGKVLQKATIKLTDPNIEGIESQLQEVEEHNKRYERRKNYEQLRLEHKESENQSEVKTKKIKGIDSKKEEIMANIKFPIKGLSFDEYGVTYQEIPLQQASKTQQLKIAVAIGISMKPKLRIIRILDGALLTSKNMKVIEQMANNRDFQVWMEIASDVPIGIFIEDGEVRSSMEGETKEGKKIFDEAMADEEEARELAEEETQ